MLQALGIISHIPLVAAGALNGGSGDVNDLLDDENRGDARK